MSQKGDLLKNRDERTSQFVLDKNIKDNPQKTTRNRDLKVHSDMEDFRHLRPRKSSCPLIVKFKN